MAKLDDRLDGLLSRDISAGCGTPHSNANAERTIRRLSKRNVATVQELIEQLPSLPRGLQSDAISLIDRFKAHQATDVLMELLFKRSIRLEVASAVSFLRKSRRAVKTLIRIGQRELSAEQPDSHWLWAVILGLANADDPESADILVTILERFDLPGWLRGDAADKLGYNRCVRDQRSVLHRRSRDAAVGGICDDSIEVQFGSLYLLGTLCCHRPLGSRTQMQLQAVLPKICEIAAHDHRLAPGYWWPMSAEAEDIIHCIQHGTWKMPDASERWLGNAERGPMEPRDLD